MNWNSLFDRLKNSFETYFSNISLEEVTLAATVILVAIVLSLLIGPVSRRLFRAKSGGRKNGSTADALVPPLRVLPLIIAIYIAAHIFHLSGKPSVFAGQILKSLIIAMLFWALARLCRNIDLLFKRMKVDLAESARQWLTRGIQLLVLACGAAIILEIWNIPVAPLIGSLGVFGIAVGFAAKDLFSNLISGLLIMTEKRFGHGEWIKVDGVIEGTVERIDFRSTRIRRFDLSPAYVPNSLLADNAMTNFSRMTYRRINWMVGLEYSTPPHQLAEIRDGVEHWLKDDPRICQPPEASLFVRIDSFGESSINLMIYCFTKTTVWADWLAVKEDFALAMIPIVKGAGSGFAFPTRSVYLQQIDPPEIINPAATGLGHTS